MSRLMRWFSIVLSFALLITAVLTVPGLAGNRVTTIEQATAPQGAPLPAQGVALGVSETAQAPNIHHYFVPFNDDNLQLLFAEIYNLPGDGGQCLLGPLGFNASTDMRSFLSVTASSDASRVYYDHWEDGYDVDPVNPAVGSTTELVVLDAGVTKTFNDLVATPRTTTNVQYDGRDRITVMGDPAAVIRAVYPEVPGEVLAGAWEVPEVSAWGQSYHAVIGEDLQINAPPAPNDFDYVALQVMAAEPDTDVWVNGAYVTTLGVGDTYLIDGENNGPGGGGLDSTDNLTATAPIQAQVLGAACDFRHSARAYTLQPAKNYGFQYWAPVPDFTSDGVWCTIETDFVNGFTQNDRDTDIYVHNPGANAITVTFDDGTLQTDLNVPSDTTISLLEQLGTGEYSSVYGAHLFSADPFWGVSAIDSVSGDAYPASSASNHSDWGYSLIPVRGLSSAAVMGWSPGNSLPDPRGDLNGSLAFVSAITDTLVFADFTQDGLPDQIDINGDGDANDFGAFFNPNFNEPTSNDGVPLAAGQVLRVSDPLDHDLTGAVIYTPDPDQRIAVAWGQDPCRARVSYPFLDLGYSVLPRLPAPQVVEYPILQISKVDDRDPVRPGELLTYTVMATNTGTSAALGVVLYDTLPQYLTYQPGTLNLTLPFTVTTSVTRVVPISTTFSGNYADDFDLNAAQTSGYTGSDGNLTWSTAWTEVGDDGSPNTGDVQVGQGAVALSPPGYLLLTDTDDTTSGVDRMLDISAFVSPTLRFYVSGVNDGEADDTFSVLIDGTPALTQQYAGPYVRAIITDALALAAGPNTVIGIRGNAGLEAGEVYRIDNVRVTEASPLRSSTTTLVDSTTTVSYTTQSGIDPVGYDPVSKVMTVTNPVAIPAGAYARFSFQVQVGIPLPNTTVRNLAVITSTNLMTIPFPLEVEEPTTIVSSHVLTITKADEPDPVLPGQLLTYTLNWGVGGDEPAPGVVVTDNLPLPYVSFVSCLPRPECQGETAPGSGVVTWDLGDRLPALSGIIRDGGLLTMTVNVEQRPPSGVFTNTTIIDDATDTPPDQDDEPTRVPNASFALSKRRVTASPVGVGEPVQFLIAITNTGSLTITRLPLVDTYDPIYLQYVSAVPTPTTALPGQLVWDDLAAQLPGAVLPPAQSTQVVVDFTAITSTQSLSPPVTINTAISQGTLTDAGELPPQQDDDDVEIESGGGTSIVLLYYRANPRAGDVLVEWATLLEVDTYGFWLYRGQDDRLSHATQVAFVPATGRLGTGAAYQYLDIDAPAGMLNYWLVEVETTGLQTAYGPVSVWSDPDAVDFSHRIFLPVVRRE
jgi:uncharacterized repeat protein (TIGR01451 family)